MAIENERPWQKIRSIPSSTACLTAAAHFWLLAALGGQWLFVNYIANAYAGHVLTGNLHRTTEAMVNAYVSGDAAGNVAAAAHMLLALVIMLGGGIQLIPAIRSRLPEFHRWNGRVYLSGVVLASIAGLIMMWGRGTYSMGVKLGGTGNAVLIFSFAALALRAALARDFISHRRWALRLFIAASAVWFFRVILMAWVALLGPVGIHFETASGPFLEIMAFGQYLIPLALLEGYLRAKESPRPEARYAMAAILFVCTLVMCAGIAVAGMAEWWGWD